MPPGNLLYQLGELLAIVYVRMVWAMEQAEVDMYRQRRVLSSYGDMNFIPNFGSVGLSRAIMEV